jgi:group II intron reverse transcriptase/maturase
MLKGRVEFLNQGIFFANVQTTMNSAKHDKAQMNLGHQGEWDLSVGLWSGSQVKAAANKCTEEWLAACREERTLTSDMMSQIADVSNLSLACQRVINNGGSGGVDGMEVKELRQWFASSYRKLADQLLSGSYLPSAVKGVKIPKPKGGYRQLGISTVKDRLVQQAIAQVMIPRYERIFSEHSYGFRPGRGAHGALHQASEYVSTGKSYVVDIDLAKFFDEVQHDRLMWLLSTRIGDSRVLQLISRFLQSGLLEGGLLSQRIKGTPQGGPLSPLLSNIVLDELDKELERRGYIVQFYK